MDAIDFIEEIPVYGINDDFFVVPTLRLTNCISVYLHTCEKHEDFSFFVIACECLVQSSIHTLN